jgi:hypothetical protein
MKRKLLVSLLFLSFYTLSFCQINVTGKVTDQLKNAIAGATVSVINEGRKEGATTDQSGFFQVALAQPGLYERIARFIPSLHVQLQLNNLAKSDMKNHLRFLDAATSFHEETRLHFYPKIFENRPSTSEDWSQWKQASFQDHTSVTWVQLALPLVLFITFFAVITGWQLNQSIHKKQSAMSSKYFSSKSRIIKENATSQLIGFVALLSKHRYVTFGFKLMHFQ